MRKKTQLSAVISIYLSKKEVRVSLTTNGKNELKNQIKVICDSFYQFLHFNTSHVTASVAQLSFSLFSYFPSHFKNFKWCCDDEFSLPTFSIYLTNSIASKALKKRAEEESDLVSS
jgi:hypothetical protein